MSALDDIIKEHAKHDPRRGYEKRDAATAELAQLRASDIRTMEHCDVCGSLLALDADALEDVEPFCPYCEYQEAIIMISEREKTIESLRADLQAAQERIAQLEAAQAFSDAEQARQLDAARSLIIRSGRVVNNLKKPDSVYDLTSDLLEWLAANPAPQESQTPNGEGRP